MSTWPAEEDAAIAGMKISWDQALVCRQLGQHDVLLGQAHRTIRPCAFSVSLSRRKPRSIQMFNFFFFIIIFFPPAWAAQVNHWNSVLCWSWSASFFSFLNIFLAAKETWCRKSSSESLHMAPVAKETTEDACRPLCRALKCSCALGGLRSMWVKKLWRKQNCYF